MGCVIRSKYKNCNTGGGFCSNFSSSNLFMPGWHSQKFTQRFSSVGYCTLLKIERRWFKSNSAAFRSLIGGWCNLSHAQFCEDRESYPNPRKGYNFSKVLLCKSKEHRGTSKTKQNEVHIKISVVNINQSIARKGTLLVIAMAVGKLTWVNVVVWSSIPVYQERGRGFKSLKTHQFLKRRSEARASHQPRIVCDTVIHDQLPCILISGLNGTTVTGSDSSRARRQIRMWMYNAQKGKLETVGSNPTVATGRPKHANRNPQVKLCMQPSGDTGLNIHPVVWWGSDLQTKPTNIHIEVITMSDNRC